MIHSFRNGSLALFFAITAAASYGQATQSVTDKDLQFKTAKELYQKGQVSIAYPLLRTLYYDKSDGEIRQSNIPATTKLESEYYRIACGLMMNEATSVDDANHFINSTYSEPRSQMLSFYLGEYYFRKSDFANAILNFNNTSMANLSNEEIAAMKFHLGYSYFMQKDFDKAEPLFNAIRQIPSDPNYNAANYYYGFLELDKKNYDQALNAFKVVENDPEYSPIVPYYIAQIYYLEGDADKAVDYAQNALNKGNQYYAKDLQQLVGHALFDQKKFSEALPYLEQYVTQTEDVPREDIYELSFCYYEAKQYDNAALGFKRLGGKEDSLAQNSMYLLGDIYLKKGDKANARNAFLFCATNSSNPEQKEISQYNYAKLSYELGYSDIALNELKNFQTTYPNSTYKTEANELLVNVLANTNNYQEALNLIDKTGRQSEMVQRAYPRILYGRAVELINDQQTSKANELLDELIQAPYNEKELPLANFWKGELAFRNKGYKNSIDYLKKYLNHPYEVGDASIKNARYDLGYDYLRTQDYKNAAQNFATVVPSNISASNSHVEQDAYMRLADAEFMQRQYSLANQKYQRIISQNMDGSDYAYYQRAVIAGANGNQSLKIQYLKEFDQKYHSSTLAANANMEMANTYMSQQKFDQAMAPLNTVLGNPNASAVWPTAMLNLGICQYNVNNNNAALSTFQKLISKYPNSDESKDALDYVKSIYMANGQPNEYVYFMQKNGMNVSQSEADSLSFSVAMDAFSNGQNDKALPLLQNYIKSYPDGANALAAHYQLASIENQNKSYNAAAQDFAYVASKAPNKYAENATLQLARIQYFQDKDYEKAANTYLQLKNIATTSENKLEAMRGLLRCQYKTNQWSDAKNNAQDLLKVSNIATDDKQMSRMILAKNEQLNDDMTAALKNYQAVAALGQSEYSAEALYQIASIYFMQNKLKPAETAAFKVIDKAGSYDYWITRAYILLGDIYYKENDYFNAEATYKSVSENAGDANLKAEATQKLKAVRDTERKNGNKK